MSNTTSVAAADRKYLQFTYNWENKRTEKKVSAWDTGTSNWSSPTNNIIFLLTAGTYSPNWTTPIL